VVKCQHLQCTNVKDDSTQNASQEGFGWGKILATVGIFWDSQLYFEKYL